MTKEETLRSDINLLQELLYIKCDFRLTNLKLNPESAGYGACSFQLNGHRIEHRISKITPTKAGQFVSIWKRNDNSITRPFDISDDFDFVVITAKAGDQTGQFIFPKSILADKGIISHNGKDGKRGIRIYPSWDSTTNKQAQKTQSWQTNYFIVIEPENNTNPDLARKLFNDKY